MAKGLPKSLIAKYGISKKAWEVYRGLKGKRKVYKPQKPSLRTKVKAVARRRWHKKRRRNQKKISLAVAAGLAGTLLKPNDIYVHGTLAYAKEGHIPFTVGNIVSNLTGYAMEGGSWSLERLIQGVTPLAMGCLVHMSVGRFANKYLKLPYVNI